MDDSPYIFSIIILSGALLWLGWLNWKLASQLYDAEEQAGMQHELIMSMAKELNELGSPNVSIAETPSYQIKYGNK